MILSMPAACGRRLYWGGALQCWRCDRQCSAHLLPSPRSPPAAQADADPAVLESSKAYL